MGAPLGVRSRRGNQDIIQPATSSVFNPATLSGITGWWRTNFAASPWVDQLALHNFAEATNPPAAGTALNGLTPANFDGINDRLIGPAASTLFNVNAGGIWCLFNGDAAPPAASSGYDEPSMFTTANADVSLTFNSTGVGFLVQDTVAFRVFYVAASVSNYHLAQMKWDGANMRYRVDSGAWTSSAAGSTNALPALAQMGPNYALAAFFKGRIAEIGTTNVATSDADMDSVKSYINSRYALAL